MHHPVASYLALAAAPTGNAAELFAVVAVIYAVCLFTAAMRRARTRRGPVMARRRGRRLTRNQKFAAAAVAAGLLLALAHAHTPPPAATASAPAAIAGCGGSNEALANCMAAAAPYGWTGGQTTCLDWLWTRESNFQTGRHQPPVRRLRHPAIAARRQDGRRRGGLADQPGHPDPLGPFLHRRHLRHPVRRLEPRTGRGLVLTPPARTPAERAAADPLNLPEGGTQVTKAELITLLVMAVGLWLLIQFTGLKFWHAAVVFAAGFYLATSAAGSQISDLASRILATFGH